MEESRQKIRTGYHYACVIKDGKYRDFVLVHEFDDGTEEIYAYTLQEGETLIDARPPLKKIHAESDGFILPEWNGTEWAETATEKEIEEWNEEHPAPEPAPPSTEERLTEIEEQLLATDEVAVELYENQLAQEEINIAQDEAIVALYEMMEV